LLSFNLIEISGLNGKRLHIGHVDQSFCAEEVLQTAGNSTPFTKLYGFTLKRAASIIKRMSGNRYIKYQLQNIAHILYNFIPFSGLSKEQLLDLLYYF
jgi:hypothetical protein